MPVTIYIKRRKSSVKNPLRNLADTDFFLHNSNEINTV